MYTYIKHAARMQTCKGHAPPVKYVWPAFAIYAFMPTQYTCQLFANLSVGCLELVGVL